MLYMSGQFFLYFDEKMLKKMHSGRYCIQICVFSSKKLLYAAFLPLQVYNTCLNAFFQHFFVKIEKNCPDIQQSNIFFVKIVPIYIFDDFLKKIFLCTAFFNIFRQSKIFCQSGEKLSQYPFLTIFLKFWISVFDGIISNVVYIWFVGNYFNFSKYLIWREFNSKTVPTDNNLCFEN